MKHMFGSTKKPHIKDRAVIGEALMRRLEPTGVFPNLDEALSNLAASPRRVYWGIDPTGPDVHLGHAIPLLFLKNLWDLGHTPVIVIGDFTAQIGDPTGKSATRKPLTLAEIKVNERHYVDQISKILPRGSFEVKHNGDWLAKLTFADVIKLAAQTTVQQMVQRDMFQERLKNNHPIGLHEFLYPLMQGYDSVAMAIDGEVGGNDQTFNMLVGRDLEKKLINKEKMVFANRLLVDVSSGKKMSKSEGDLIAVSDSPQEIRRKVLALDDGILRTVAELCTEKPYAWIDERQPKGELPKNPRAFKEDLADELVRMFHGPEAVKKAHEAQNISIDHEGVPLAQALKEFGLVGSMSAAKNLIDQGGVEVNGEIQKDWSHPIKPGDQLRVGKGKFIEVK